MHTNSRYLANISKRILRKYRKAGADSVENPNIIFTENPEIKEYKGALYPTNPAFIAFFAGKRDKLTQLNKIQYDDYQLVE